MRAGPLPPLLLSAALAAGCHTRHVLGEVDDGGRPAIEPCGPFVPGNDFRPCAATYLSGSGAEPTAAVAIGAQGAVLVAATLEGNDFGVTPTVMLGGGAGAVVRLAPDGRRVLSVTRLGSAVADLEVDPRRERVVVLGTPFGVAVLSPDARQLVWQQPATGTRVAVGSEGTVAVLDPGSGQVAVFEASGTPRGTFPARVEGGTAADVAVHGASRTIVVTGTLTAGPVRQPFLNGHGYGGELKWRNYGWRDTDVAPARLTAATRGVAVAIGRDDRLYYLGDSHGGNTSHGQHPRALDEDAVSIRIDHFTHPYQTSNQVLFLARFQPDTGAYDRGQFLLTRNPATASGDGQNVFGADIAADERGTVLVGGRLRCCVRDADAKTLHGQRLTAPAAQEDAFALVVSADFTRRHLWTTFGTGGASAALGVALARGVAALVARQDAAATARPFVTHEAVQPRPGGGASDGYLVVWPAP